MEKLKIELIKISKNLMLEFSNDDITNIANELINSIKPLEKIHEIDLSKVVPTNFLKITIPNDFRDDIVEDFPNKKELLENSKEFISGYIKV